MVLAVEWAKLKMLVDHKTIWYKERWDRGLVLENEGAKLVWDFEYQLRKTTTCRRPDLTLEDKESKMVMFCDMACPQEHNIDKKRAEKKNKYQQLAFETRERRKGYKVKVVPIVIGCLGGGVEKTLQDVSKIFECKDTVTKIVGLMQKTILMDSETIIRKVLSGLVESIDNEE